jgi:hypothetical protein
MKKSKKVNFDHYIAAAIQLVEEFRDELHVETARLTQAKIDISNNGCSIELPQAHYDPGRHAFLHRLRIASDNFLSVLSGNY